jgi:DNA repair exonuclease SbcCD nuclease subunit
VVILGDLLDTHERIHTIPMNRAYEFINKMRNVIKTFVLVGNHDMINHEQFLTNNHWLNALKEWDNVTIVDKVVSYSINSHNFIFSPFVPNGRFVEGLNTLETDWKDATCIFAHQEFYGCKMGAFNSIDGDKWELDSPNVISGHIHLNQNPQKNIYYPGSSLSVAFGESTKNIIAYVTFKEENLYDLEEMSLDLPKKKIIYVDSEDVDNLDIQKSEDKIKVSISGGYEDFKSFKKTKKYKELVDKGVKVVFKPKRVEIKEQKASIKESLDNNPNDFNDIIKCLIDNEKNTYLFQAYEMIVNSKTVDTNDILFL